MVEQQRGITYARNRALIEAGAVDFIAFIDDDEFPAPEWLDTLLWTQANFAADVVSGPVFPKYSPEIPDWVKRGGFFKPRVFATGTGRKTCACNNVLIGTHVFRRVHGFDDAFALSGAEDTNFFLRVRRAGYKIVWSQQAVVYEVVSAQRGTVSWILRREYQTGNGWVFCERCSDSLGSWILRFFKGGGHVVIGTTIAIWRLLTMNKAGVVCSLQRVSLGTGMLAGLIGHRFLAYQNAGTNLKELREAGARLQ
jgi:GT2 family glycosyltransferase